MTMLQQLNECKYLFLSGIFELKDNALCLLIEEAKPSNISEDVTILNVTLHGVRKVEHDDTCRVFEVSWERYICYSVVNESFAHVHKPDTYTGQRVRLYSESPFLEYVRSATFASNDNPDPYKHFSIVCENHIIEVTSPTEPQVRLIEADQLDVTKAT